MLDTRIDVLVEVVTVLTSPVVTTHNGDSGETVLIEIDNGKVISGEVIQKFNNPFPGGSEDRRGFLELRKDIFNFRSRIGVGGTVDVAL